MIRVIPKNSRAKITIFKNFTWVDLVILTCAFGLMMLLFASNFNNSDKWIIFAVFSLTVGLLLTNSDDGRLYVSVLYIINYLLSRKVFEFGKSGRGSIWQLIPFMYVRDDGIIIYNGYFGAVVEVGSIEFSLLDEDEQDRRISAFGRLLNELSQGTTIQLVKIDRPIRYDKVARNLYEDLSAARDEAADRAKIAVLSSRLEQIDEVNNVSPQFRPYYYIVLYSENEIFLKTQVDVCRDRLDNIGLNSSMLDGKQAAIFLKYNYSRNFDERDIDDVADRAHIKDYIAPKKIKFKATGFKCDDVFATTFVIKNYPLLVGNSWGAGVFNMPNTKIVLTIRPVDKYTAIKRIDRAIGNILSQNHRKLSESQEKQTYIDTMADLQRSIQNENEMLFDCTFAITAYNYTDKTDLVFRKDIRRKLLGENFELSQMLFRQFDAFSVSTLGQNNKRVFERGFNSESLAAVFPFVFSSLAEERGFTLGGDLSGYPTILDIWKRDGQHKNSNILIYGTSGSGKSYFTKLLVSMVYSQNSRIFLLDPENEYQTLAANVGGKFIDVGSASSGRLNPLHIYPVLTDEGKTAAPEITFNSHLHFLDSFFRITLEGIVSDSFEELNACVIKMYEKHGIKSNTDCSNFSPEQFPTFNDLYNTVDEQLKSSSLSAERRGNLERVKVYLTKFTSEGMYSSLWCGASTITADERLVVFNFQSLFGAKNNVVANAQILMIMRYLEQQIINIREFNRGKGGGDIVHPFIVLDEAHMFVNPKYPLALNFTSLMFKRIRKYDGGIVFTTQNLSDVLNRSDEINAETAAIVSNSQYSFIFNLAANDMEMLENLYKNAGAITVSERSFITNAGKGDCFAICAPHERICFHVQAHENVQALFDYSDAFNFINKRQEIIDEAKLEEDLDDLGFDDEENS